MCYIWHIQSICYVSYIYRVFVMFHIYRVFDMCQMYRAFAMFHICRVFILFYIWRAFAICFIRLMFATYNIFDTAKSQVSWHSHQLFCDLPHHSIHDVLLPSVQIELIFGLIRSILMLHKLTFNHYYTLFLRRLMASLRHAPSSPQSLASDTH